ncbi:hypothetical protein OU683_04305 [Salinimicrobium sp. TH3]|nr:hypothetical protein [Salinimicrobium sp. TH3]
MTREVISADNIKKISLSGDEVFKVSFSTGPGKEVVITTHTEGEYFNDISLDAELRDETLILASRYREILQNGYDKLSAHKVFSMEVELEIPKNMIIEVNSNVASVYLTGIYEQVIVQLKNGSCYLEDFLGDAVINTYDGNILGTARSINAEAKSRNGEVEIPNILHGNHKMVLTSINGDIKISETK